MGFRRYRGTPPSDALQDWVETGSTIPGTWFYVNTVPIMNFFTDPAKHSMSLKSSSHPIVYPGTWYEILL